MNYYSHHIGDYATATRHLTWEEDLAYRRMMEVYYLNEKPLPADVKRIYKLVMCQTAKQRQAVDAVLDEFFTATEDGYHHKRCDAEIAKMQAAGEATDERRDAEAERQRRHRAERKELFAKLKDHGVTMPFSTPTDALRVTLQERDSHAAVTRDERDRPRLPNTQYPIPNSRAEVVARARDPDADLEIRLREAAGWQNDPSPKLAVTGEIQSLIDNGADLDLDVLPIVKALAPQSDGRSWSYFVKAIARQRDKRISAATIVTEPTAGGQNRHGTTQQKPSRSDTFAAINARIAQLAEAERAATGDGFPDDGSAAQGPA